MLAVGCHISSSGGFEAMGKRALALGATTFAYFTRNPRGGAAKAADPEDAASLRKIMAENGFGRLVAHAPYTLNLCSAKPDVRSFARRALAEDLQTMELVPGNYYNFHPGSHVGQGANEGIRLIAEGLNEVLEPGQSTCVLLETMAGKGTEVGRAFEELARIIELTEHDELIGVCLDTCHVSDAGYDVSASLDGVLQEFDRVIGLSRLKALHLNDSKNPVGAHKDRHERLGLGYLGLGCFSAIVRDERTRDLPMILETPNEAAGYAAEIAALRALADGADTKETMARLAHERDE
ncbi:deoxyribonuclease IV [uncultured Parolsenella sp.]|uniref:deoxyribonuclease IV n=1 Tax=uncultured Parolsenella sp. TaxID=2083008 RepID=UPI0025932302|nr:deoxyribonuclease IV [uncultured Parolsenella sp.]